TVLTIPSTPMWPFFRQSITSRSFCRLQLQNPPLKASSAFILGKRRLTRLSPCHSAPANPFISFLRFAQRGSRSHWPREERSFFASRTFLPLDCSRTAI